MFWKVVEIARGEHGRWRVTMRRKKLFRKPETLVVWSTSCNTNSCVYADFWIMNGQDRYYIDHPELRLARQALRDLQEAKRVEKINRDIAQDKFHIING